MNTPLGLKIFVGFVVLAIVVVVGYGIYLVGSPAGQRLIKFDDRRVSDLENISRSIDTFWESNGELPGSLQDLQGPQYFVRAIEDPATGEPYEYRTLNETEYELCAVFSSDSAERGKDSRRPFSPRIWDHGPGRACFQLEAASPGNRRPSEGPQRVPESS